MLDIIEKDLTLLRTLASVIERLGPDGRRLKPREVVAGFDKYLHDELDLVREAPTAASCDATSARIAAAAGCLSCRR